MADAGFDELTVGELRRRGGLKWSLFPEAIGAFVAEMDFGTAPAVTEALHAAVDGAAFGYLSPALLQGMSEAYAAWSADRYGWTVPSERVRPVADVLAGLAAAIEHFSRPGSPVVLPTPAYMPFLTLPPALGREVVQVPMARDGDRYVYDLDALDAAFRAGGHLLVLCNPHNPIGRVLEPAEMTAVAEVVERHGGRVFSDEIHAPLVYEGHRHVPYASLGEVPAGHAVSATSASKAWNLPGLKCAQLVLSNDADADLWARVGPHAEHGASTLGVLANTAAYTGGAGWLDDVLAYLDGNRRLLADLVAEHLPGVRYTPPEGTYLAWLDCRELELPEPGAFFLERAGVALTDGALCGVAGTGFARLNVATPRPVLVQAVEQMGAALTAR
ncbi:cystathione beta-lyase [Geodermatophilus siccatus]|uniref:cysteine-S-conjugate beta-lyase n=1 Tax=Geodermatophilus siccatus TaxID=1137991 RepID=A0A1G9VXV9_9ACTN|nr:aminotransferase class I/II-fold pyridoxal phosphate-dependent enzyme [Geodermatophilus siccatus]SDM77084.1 cystathione beta-lyase [Geodermatophilus siccatus]